MRAEATDGVFSHDPNHKVGLRNGRVSVDASTPVCPQTWLGSSRNFAKTRFRRSPSTQCSANKNFFGKIFRSRKSFYAFLVQFWRLDRQTDLTINFLAIFRSRCTYYELCTTKNRRKCVRRRSGVRFGSPPVQYPPFAFGLFFEAFRDGRMVSIDFF